MLQQGVDLSFIIGPETGINDDQASTAVVGR